jgi:hypothetical protein
MSTREIVLIFRMYHSKPGNLSPLIIRAMLAVQPTASTLLTASVTVFLPGPPALHKRCRHVRFAAAAAAADAATN